MSSPTSDLSLLYALEAWIESMTADQIAAIDDDGWAVIIELRERYLIPARCARAIVTRTVRVYDRARRGSVARVLSHPARRR